MKNNKKGFSLVLAMGVTLIMSLLAFTILEYMIPFSKNVKGIENSSKAFYQANAGIENALYAIKGEEAGYESGTTLGTLSLDTAFNIQGIGANIPPAGLGNSDYDLNYNKLSRGNPIQLQVGYNKIPSFDWNSNANFYFKLPINGTLSGAITLPIINWQLIGETNSLNASGSYIKVTDINTPNTITFYNRKGKDGNGNSDVFNTFYGNNCGINSGCILKLSVINSLELNTGDIIPYLEWKIVLGNSKTIPLRYARFKGEGKSSGFRKELNIKIAQQTVIEAFDFTVLQ